MRFAKSKSKLLVYCLKLPDKSKVNTLRSCVSNVVGGHQLQLQSFNFETIRTVRHLIST